MEASIRIILKPLRRFATVKTNASLLLFLATALAMFFANSHWSDSYNDILMHPIDFQIGNFTPFMHNGHAMPLLTFVNDALMAIFFFVIGLEIKQEVLIGELSSMRKAILPIIAACGGMVVPVLFYYVICPSAPAVNGVAIPMATDIAFALAVLGLLGKRVPLSMRIFLTALAVVDDIGGIIIIALFYSGSIAYEPLLISVVLLVVLYFGGRFGIHKSWFYYLLGFIVWMLFMESGIHPTIAGVLVAMTVPARPRLKLDDFTAEMHELLGLLDSNEVLRSQKASVLTPLQIQVLNNIHMQANQSISPLQRIADRLHPLVNFLILPLFAFVNAGVTFGQLEFSSLKGIPLAVFLGLFVGKTLGIYSFTSLSVRLRLATMPTGVKRSHLFGISMLGGIGFTVALFIANLSFSDGPMGTDLLNQAKLGVFVGSFVSGICGYYFLNAVLPKTKLVETVEH